MAGEIQLNSTTLATESSGSITAELDTIRPNSTNGSLTLQGDSSDAGVTGLTIDSSGVVNTTTAKVTNIQATSGQSLTINDEDGNAAITVGTDNTAASYLSLNFGSYHGDSGGAGSGSSSANILDDYEEGTWTLTGYGSSGSAGTYAQTVYGSPFYTKIGNIVTVSGSFSITNLGSYSGEFRIGTLPFSISTGHSSLGCYGSIRLQSTNYDSGASLLTEVGNGNSHIRVQAVVSGTGNNPVQFSELTTSTFIGFTLIYRTN